MNIEYLTGVLHLETGTTFVSDQNTFRRFMSMIKSNGNSCWEWTGATVKGYGHFRVMSSSGWIMMRSHVYAARVVNRVTASVIRHTCDNTLCCNPEHLIEGTHQDNSNDMKSRGRAANGNRTVTKALLESGKLLDEEKVRTIRKMKSEGISQTKIAATIGVTKQSVSNVLTGKTWRHVL